ncbi:hypothetical protein AB0953_23380 [Streptomyces sp. NPDC046866]|uniref:hypothetical protein n=1 Tax=Streptomyces sp. NPDC046866 TaxID=3154921 RepID=UPI003452C075
MLPLSVLNTMVWRGLPPTSASRLPPSPPGPTPALRDADPFLREECRVVPLGEVASVTVPWLEQLLAALLPPLLHFLHR